MISLTGVKKLIWMSMILTLSGCAGSNPERDKINAIAKRNPLDMANEDAKVVVLKKADEKPKYPKVPTQDARTAPFISGKSSKIYHVRGCEYAGKLDAVSGFASCDDAERSGRVPCEFCKPRENAK